MLEQARKPGRPRKASDEASEANMQRRRRRESAGTTGRRLAANMAELDLGNYQYRWINDEPARIMSKTQYDDWDIVRQSGDVVKDDSADMGDAVSAIVGRHPDGSPKVAYLCRKLKEFYEEDQKAKGLELDEQLKELRRGLDRQNGQADYVPAGNSGI